MSDTSLKIDEINSLFETYLAQEKRRISNIKSDYYDCLCFIAQEDNSTVKFNGTANMEYSLDGSNWIAYPNTKPTITLGAFGDTMYVKCNNDNITGGFATTGKIKLAGNIMSLLNWKQNVPNGAFAGLFSGNSAIIDVSELRLPAKKISDKSYSSMFSGTSITTLPIMSELEQISAESLFDMFNGCNQLEFVNVPMPKKSVGGNGNNNVISSMFKNCTGLKYVNVDTTNYIGQELSQTWYFGKDLLKGCTGLKIVRLANIHDFYVSRHFFEHWLQDAASDAILVCPPDLDTSTKSDSTVLSGWTIIKGGNEWDKTTTNSVETISTDSFMVSPSKTVSHITFDTALTLNAQNLVASTDVAYAEVVLDFDSNATLTAGSNITFVDEPTAGMRNICVVRWADGVAKLYVTITEELPESSSSSSSN